MANTPTVKHISECFIKPKHEIEDAAKPLHLGPGDLPQLSTHYIQKGLLFSKPNSIKTLLDNLKHSLSLALAHFYPLAGQFESQIDEEQHTTSIFINCKKGQGARLIHASLDMKISQIQPPQGDVPLVVQSLFDHDRAVNYDGHTRPLLSVQVTELVDGVFIGCSMNHVCGDGTSYWNFFNTLSEIFMANGEDIVISRPPIHKRWFIAGTGPVFKLPYTSPDEFIERYEAPKMRERIFHFSANSIAKLKEKANQDLQGNNNISSFQALLALVWRCITKARHFPDDLQTICKLVIDNRARLSPPLSSNYFGNAIHVVQGETTVGELLSHNLGWAALLIHQVVKQYSDEEVRCRTKAWIESPMVIRFGACFNPQAVHMGSSPRFDMYGVEFGMGKAIAVLSGYANKFDGKTSSYPGREGGGSIDLEVCLAPDSMSALELDEEFMEVVSQYC